PHVPPDPHRVARDVGNRREFTELREQFGLVPLPVSTRRRHGRLSDQVRGGCDARHHRRDAERAPPPRGHRARAPLNVRAKNSAAASYAATQCACVRKSWMSSGKMSCSTSTPCGRRAAVSWTVWLNCTLRSSSPWINSTGE